MTNRQADEVIDRADGGPKPRRHDVATPRVGRPRTSPGCPKGLVIKLRVGGDTLYANRRFEAGEPVFQFERVIWYAEPDTCTFEHPSGRHFFDPILARAAHASDPNCRIAPDLMVVIARRDIARGERITVRGTSIPRVALAG